MEWNDRVVVLDHPIVQHKLAILRDKHTPSNEFRDVVRELSLFETYEATRDLPLTNVFIQTPIAPFDAKQITGRKVAFVPILRAGLGMVDGALEVIPRARVGHLGMQRNEETHEPESYYDKLPRDIASRRVYVLDPMLATGGSAEAAVKYLREAGVSGTIRFLCLVSAPEGIERLLAADDDLIIYTCAIDDGLNENAYIVPGLGDAGDRIFGTK